MLVKHRSAKCATTVAALDALGMHLPAAIDESGQAAAALGRGVANARPVVLTSLMVRMIPTLVRLAAPATLIVGLGACASDDGGSQADESESLDAVLSETVDVGDATTGPDGTATVSVTDGSGAEVVLDSPAVRIVCLDGSCIDALYELGVTPAAVLNPAMATHPSYFGPDTGIETIAGSFFEPDVEEVIGVDADLVIGTAGVHSSIVAPLGGLTPVYLQSIEDLDDARAFLSDIGVLTGRPNDAEGAVERFDALLSDYAAAIHGDAVPLSMYGSDLDFGIDASNSIIGRTLAEVTAYPWPEAPDANGFLDFNVEGVLQVDPDAIFVQTFAFDGATAPLSDQLADNPLWGELTAVQDGRVIEVDTAWWASGRSTRTMTLVLDAVMPVLYPDADLPTSG